MDGLELKYFQEYFITLFTKKRKVRYYNISYTYKLFDLI